jgi:hypothetical protein
MHYAQEQDGPYIFLHTSIHLRECIPGSTFFGSNLNSIDMCVRNRPQIKIIQANLRS